MSNNYGDGVSRVLDAATAQFQNVIWREGCPPLDSEWNLVGDLAAGLNRQQSLRGTPSGWYSNDINPSKDYQTNPTWSNWFKFGRQRSSDKQSIMWAAVNGWLVPVAGTKTGDPPGSPDDLSTWNKILLDPPPGSAGDARADFVFLECFKVRISPYPSTLNKPNASAIYKLGNIEGGMSYLPDDLIDPEIGEATTERVQLQYRIRVVKGLINLGTNPDGFDPSVVKAQGTQATPPSIGGYTYTNMREELGDPGLWRAGDGTTNVLGTVDGYCYAIPIAIIFRRNSILWAGEPAQNLNGGFNRNPLAIDRTGSATFSTTPTLASNLSSSALSVSLVSAANIPLPATPSSTVTIKIDEELISYSSISGTTITLVGRGVNGTAAAEHKAGAVITVVSSRPDGLYSDQVTLTDILDLRHAVNPAGFNYASLLRSNLDKLLKGQLRANWKKTGADPRGIYNIYQDKISATPAASLGVTTLDAPDHIRMVFSDAAIQQAVEVIAAPVSLPATFPVSGTVTWGLTIQSTILAQATTERWSIGDQIRIPVSQFKNGVSVSDADQVRFLNDQPASGTGESFTTHQLIDGTANFVNSGVEVGDTLVIFAGVAAGSYTITEVTTTVLTVSTTIPAALASSYVIRKGTGALQIRIDGQATALDQHRFIVTPANPLPTDDLTITFTGSGSPFPTPSNSSNLYITTHIQYGCGRGLSRRPDSIHNVTLLNPGSTLLHQTEYLQTGTFPLRTAWTALWSKYRSDSYKSLLPVTAEAYVDLGSKTVAITPFQVLQFPVPTSITSTSIMPLGVADPLSLFDHLRYVILPRHLVPGWGSVEVPIIPTTGSGSFHRGINFMLMSHEGGLPSTDQFNPEYIEYSIGGASCAIFSTLDLQTSLPADYSTSLNYGGMSYTSNYAGMRKFNDDPTVIGALSTARGLDRHGLELPPYYGIARLFAVYEAQDYKTRGSNFNVGSDEDRSLKGTGATNLLRDNFEESTFWIEKDVNGDSTFILNADAIDISKSPNPISTFDSGDYIVEASVFGFGRGSFDLNQTFKLALTTTAPSSLILNINAILPGPISGSDTALVNYSRVPYQGDAWNTTSTFSDKGYTPGPLTSSNAYQLSSTSLMLTGLTRPNQKPLEVLASVGFITTLGTGRLSGDFSLSNAYDIRNVGYEDPTDPAAPYPPLSGSASRPLIKSGALGSLSNYGDLEASPDLLGCTERLPLGGLYRDKDFHGSRFSDEISSPLVYLDTAGVGSGVAGLARTSELDQTEVLAMPASVSAGVPGDVLVMVDGSTSDYTQLLNYRTNRGGSVFVGSGDRPGGEVFATYSRLMGSGKGTRVLVGRAFLVRNAPTLVGATQVSGGDEVMLAITTEVMELGTTPIEALILIGTNGSGEGSAAADLYRIEGHPLLANHTFYDVDPSAIELPRGKTIAQITAPSPTPVIPIGAANTVYASDGVRNYWTNIPSLTGGSFTNLSVTNNTTLGTTGTSFAGGNIYFTQYALPNIQQVPAAPGVPGRELGIYAQAPTPNSSSLSTSGGSLLLTTGSVSSASPGLRATSGPATLHSGNLDPNTVGSTGNVLVSSGTNNGSGSSGVVSIQSGQAVNGSTGLVEISGGVATGTTGSGGVVQILGGSVSSSSNPSGTGGNVLIQGGGSEAPSGSGGYILLYTGSHNTTPGQFYFTIGGQAGTRYASISNTNLVLGPVGSAGAYGIRFSSTTVNPTISQDTTTTDPNNIIVRSQNTSGLYLGGDVGLVSGTGNGPGEVFISNGTLDRMVRALATTTVTNGVFGPYRLELGSPTYYNPYSLTFSSMVATPMIGQQDTGGSGTLFTIKAASVAAASSGTGGSLRLLSGAGDLGHGEVQLATPGPAGTPEIRASVNSSGIRLRANGSSDLGISFEASPTQPTVPSGTAGVLYSTSGGNLQFRSSTGQVANLSQELARGIAGGSLSLVATTSAYESARTYEITIPGGSQMGDYLEGEVMCTTITNVAEVPCGAAIKVNFTENGVGGISPHTVGVGSNITLGQVKESHLLAFKVLLTGTGHPSISINLWAKSDGTATTVSVSNLYSDSVIWARYRIIRPAT